MATVTITMEVSAREFVQNLLGADPFLACPWYTRLRYDRGFDWEHFPEDLDRPYLTVGMRDPETDDIKSVTKKLSVNDLVRAHSELAGKHYRLDWENHDAFSADLVLQKALFGTIVYG